VHSIRYRILCQRLEVDLLSCYKMLVVAWPEDVQKLHYLLRCFIWDSFHETRAVDRISQHLVHVFI
jgi:hypothetical protein